jgi:AcrR family transcriptional regulator
MTPKLQQLEGSIPKRQKIIEATVALFRHTHDIKKVSVNDIAIKAKVSPTTIYNNFGNREALVIEAAKSLLRGIVDRSRAMLRSNMTFSEKLNGMISGKIALLSEADNEVVAKLISQDKDIAPYIDEVFRSEAKDLWREILDEGKHQGYIDTNVDTEAFYVYMDIIKAGFATRPDIFQNWKKNMTMIEKLTYLIFYGFLKKDVDLFGKKERG